jgi:hypothetical protein
MKKIIIKGEGGVPAHPTHRHHPHHHSVSLPCLSLLPLLLLWSLCCCLHPDGLHQESTWSIPGVQQDSLIVYSGCYLKRGPDGLQVDS